MTDPHDDARSATPRPASKRFPRMVHFGWLTAGCAVVGLGSCIAGENGTGRTAVVLASASIAGMAAGSLGALLGLISAARSGSRDPRATVAAMFTALANAVLVVGTLWYG